MLRTQGLNGGIRFAPCFEDIHAFERLDLSDCPFYWYPDAAATAAGKVAARVLHLAQYRYHQGCIVLEFDGLTDIDAVKCLTNGVLCIDKERMWKTDENEYLAYELENMRVVDNVTNDVLGTVLSLEDGVAHSYLIVRPPVASRKDFMIPFVHAMILSIDREGGEIRVDLPAGLTDL